MNVTRLARLSPSANWRRLLPLLALALIAAISLLAPWLVPHDPLRAVTGQELLPPSTRYPLGTDLLGRDVYSRVLYGGRSTLSVAALALALAVVPGLVVGVIAGYADGLIDHMISAVLDALLAFPGLLLALAVIAIVGNGPIQVAMAVGLGGMPSYARVARVATRSVRARPFVEAAYALGARPIRVLVGHILPNMAGPLIGFATVILSWAILNAATLNFLGLGGDPAAPEWGTMLAEGRQAFRLAPWAVIAPGLAIMITLLVVNWLADTITWQEER
jgi:peptide/nickel transport system permease protein